MYLRVLSAEGLRGTTVGSPTVVKPYSPRPDHLDQGRVTHCTVILNVSLIEEPISQPLHDKTAEQSSKHVIKILTFTTAHSTVEI